MAFVTRLTPLLAQLTWNGPPGEGEREATIFTFTENQALSTFIEGAKDQDIYIFKRAQKGQNIHIFDSCKSPT